MSIIRFISKVFFKSHEKNRSWVWEHVDQLSLSASVSSLTNSLIPNWNLKVFGAPAVYQYELHDLLANAYVGAAALLCFFVKSNIN